jgi:hypothetical protein
LRSGAKKRVKERGEGTKKKEEGKERRKGDFTFERDDERKRQRAQGREAERQKERVSERECRTKSGAFRYLLLVVSDVLDGHAILALIVASTLVGLGSPQCEVVAEQLHDEGGVLVGRLGQLVQAGDGLVEGGLGKLARGLLVLQDLVETHRIVQREAQADGVGGLEDLSSTEKTQSA